jgi:phage terminase large subunit
VIAVERELFRMRSYQREPYLAKKRGCKRFVEVLHRRAGKDRNWLNITLLSMLEQVGVYFHVFPSLNQARRDIWDNIIEDRYDGVTHRYNVVDAAFPEELRAAGGKNETEMSIKLVNGSVWQLMGADTRESIERMRGPNPIGIVLSEYAFMRHDPWPTLSPVLAENGGWIAFPSTPNVEDDNFHTIYRLAMGNPNWFHQLKTVEDTRRDAKGESGDPVITIEEIEDMRRANIREEDIQREYYCSFRGYTHGTIYGDLVQQAELDGRITRVPYTVNYPVGVCFDLGHSDAMVMWFYQRQMNSILFIDYWESTQKDIKDALRVMREAKPYMYGRVVLPWDGRSAADYMEAMHVRNVHVCDRPESLQSEIEMVRREFSRFYFDSERCARGIEALRKYARKWDDDKKSFTKEPVHNQYSHGADALRTGVAGGFDPLLYTPGVNYEVKVESDFDPRLVGAQSIGWL